MHHAKNGNQWHFGMKAANGIDADSCLVQIVIGSAANVNDLNQGHASLHGGGHVVFADAGYQGATMLAEVPGVDWHVAVSWQAQDTG